MDIGTLTGQIALEDQLTDALTKSIEKVKKYAEDFEGAMGAVAISVGVVTAAIGGAITSIVALGEKGSTLLGVENAFDKLAEAAGTTGDVLREKLNTGLKGTMDDMQQMQSVQRLMSSGFKLTGDQAELLGAAARAMGKATGTDAAHGLETMSNALLTGRTRSLSMAGIVVDLKGAEEKFAESLGVTVDQLSEEGKLEAKRQGILAATKSYVDRLGDSQLTFKERIQQTQVAMEQWGEGIAKSVASSPQVLRAFDSISDAIKRAFGGDSQTMAETIVGWINKFADAVTKWAPPIIQGFADILSGIKSVFDFISDHSEGLKTAAVAVGAYAAAWGVMTFGGSIVSGVIAGVQAIGTAITVLETGSLIGLVTPIGAIAAAVAGLAAAVYIFNQNMKDLEDRGKNLGKPIAGAKDLAGNQMLTVEDAAKAAAGKTLSPGTSLVIQPGGMLAADRISEIEAADRARKASFLKGGGGSGTDKATQDLKDYQGAVASLAATWNSTSDIINLDLQKNVDAVRLFIKTGGESAEQDDKVAEAIQRWRQAGYNVPSDLAKWADAQDNYNAELAAFVRLSPALTSISEWLKTGLMAAGSGEPAVVTNLRLMNEYLSKLQQIGVGDNMNVPSLMRLSEWLKTVEVVAGTGDPFGYLQKMNEDLAKLRTIGVGDNVNVVSLQRFSVWLQSTSRDAAGVSQVQIAFDKLAQATNNTAEDLGKLTNIGIKLKPAMSDLGPPTKAFGTSLGELANSFQQMAQIGGDTFGGIARDIGLAVTASDQLAKSLGFMSDVNSKKVGGGWNASNLASLAAGWIGVAVAVYQVVDALNKAAEAAHKAYVLSEILDGLSTRFQTTTHFSNDLAQAISDDKDSLSGLNAKIGDVGHDWEAIAAEGLHLSKVVEELGGAGNLTAQQWDDVQYAFAGLLQLVAQGGPQAVKAIKEADTALAEMGQSAVASGGFINQTFFDMIRRAQASGAQLTETKKFLLGQNQQAAGGIGDLLGGLQDSSQAASKTDFKVTSKTQGAGLGAAVAGTFAQELKNGASFKDALKDIQGPLDSLNKALDKTGFDGGAAFGKLSNMADIANDKITGPLVTSIQGANQAILGLGNSGILDQNMFSALSSTATDAYNQIIAQGKDGGAAIAIMQPTLQTMWEAEQQFGFKTDDATQALIDQGVQQGIVGEAGKDAQSKILDVLLAIGDALGAKIPAGLKGMQDASTIAASDIKSKIGGALDTISTKASTMPTNFNFDATVRYRTTGEPNGTGGTSVPVSTGGTIYASRGTVIPFVPKGTDVVPAMLTPGETVRTVDQEQQLQGQLSGGGEHVTQIIMDRKVLAQLIEKERDRNVRRRRQVRAA